MLSCIINQFESIHPFLDGNGRIGRLIIPLYLLSKGILYKPCFYISDYFERHKTEYYNALNNVRLNNDLLGWIKFFLKAVIATAQRGKDKFKAVTKYVRDVESLSLTLGGRPENVIKILHAFFDNPIMNSKQLMDVTGLSQGTVDSILKKMLNNHILTELTGYSRNRIFVLFDYIKIFAD